MAENDNQLTRHSQPTQRKSRKRRAGNVFNIYYHIYLNYQLNYRDQLGPII